MKFVLIDDDKIYLFLETKILEKAFENCEIISFSNPETGLTSLIENCQNCTNTFVLLDLNMPGLDGFQVLENLNKLENNPYKVIIVSSSSLAEDKDKAYSFPSVIGYMPKPLDTEKLKFCLEQNAMAPIY